MSDRTDELREVVTKNAGGDYVVYLFGSRASGKNKVNSDFDVGLVGIGGKKLSSLIKNKIEMELERKKFPYKVDLVDMNSVSDNFRKVAMREAVRWM